MAGALCWKCIEAIEKKNGAVKISDLTYLHCHHEPKEREGDDLRLARMRFEELRAQASLVNDAKSILDKYEPGWRKL